MKKPQYTKYSAFSITFSGPKSSAQILKKEFLEVACSLNDYKQTNVGTGLLDGPPKNSTSMGGFFELRR